MRVPMAATGLIAQMLRMVEEAAAVSRVVHRLRQVLQQPVMVDFMVEEAGVPQRILLISE